MEKEIISSRQFMIITLLFSIGTAILIIPATIASAAKQDAWIAAIIGVAISFILVKLYISLGKRTPSLTFIEANEKILGRFLGKFTAVGFIFLTFLSSGELLYFIGIFMKTEVMPETPTMAFALLFSIIIVYAAFLGIEVFARSTEILFPIFILIFIIFAVCITPQISFDNVQPILETPKKSFLYSIIRFMSIFSFPLVVLLMLFPSAVNVQKSAQKGFYIGAIIGGIVLIIIITLCILVLGPSNTASRTFPSYALAQRISIGNFLQRIEIIMAGMWIISIYIRTFMYFYASVIGVAQLCKIQDHRPLIFPFGLLMIGLSQIIHPNIVHSNVYNNEIWPIFSAIFTVILPLTLLIIAKIRKIDGNSQGENSNENQTNNNNHAQKDSENNSHNASKGDNHKESDSKNDAQNENKLELESQKDNKPNENDVKIDQDTNDH
ncbi:GerAB/ArcD/ProY family transporter [Lysinibacillus pakistanensis]|uniref:Endospore germination permease n=1 Tax=Lysinibacillus pakistanensis TaxID=759811 RepID=A0AAX3WR06_9BACI|nr:endospore germination permease [Lysinibacillus pakistanensis]MDM5233748.1 endospore germination permease [Lysinibacillus pakistanensis]WHY44371.1 endospore germination permease [Lysinibacillus pakistanensis]WHY49378.1 endospore germination permease [Lysinibacillus pakistanensis]